VHSRLPACSGVADLSYTFIIQLVSGLNDDRSTFSDRKAQRPWRLLLSHIRHWRYVAPRRTPQRKTDFNQ
jgi:hypothetical protein